MMPIFSLINLKIPRNLRNNPLNRGFTLLEILVTLFLVGLVTVSVLSGGGFIGQEQLEETVNTLERNYRFAMDEAVLRNRIVRLHFYLDRNPQEYTVEYGPDAHFVIPNSIVSQGKRKSLQEIEEFQKKQKAVNKQFTPVRELSEENKKIPENILITGIGSGLNKALINEGDVSLYIYPDGEKDSAFIAVSDDKDLSILTTDAFTNDITIGQEPLPQNIEENLLEKKFKLTRELFEKWIKK